MAPSKACCVYFNCKRNRLTHPELSFFRFPLDSVRSNKWFKNCGNVNLLGLSLKELNKKTVCAMHFAENGFMNTLRNSLVHDAIPINYTEDPGCINEPVQVKIVSSPERLILKRQTGVKTYGSCSFKSGPALSDYDNTCAVENPIDSEVLQNADMNWNDIYVVHKAVKNDNLAKLKMLVEENQNTLSCRDHYGHTPLLTSICDNRSHNLILYLIEAGSDINAVDDLENNSLHYLADIDRFKPKIAVELLKRGIDINAQNSQGSTPILESVLYGVDILMMLLYYNADVTIESDFGDTALSMALSLSNFDAVEMLIDYYSQEDLSTIITNYFYLENGQATLQSILQLESSKLFKILWPLIDTEHLLQTLPTLLIFYIDECKFPKHEWIEALLLILENNLASSFIRAMNKRLGGHNFRSLFFFLYNKKVDLEDRVMLINTFLSLGAKVSHYDIRDILNIFGYGKDFECLVYGAGCKKLDVVYHPLYYYLVSLQSDYSANCLRQLFMGQMRSLLRTSTSLLQKSVITNLGYFSLPSYVKNSLLDECKGVLFDREKIKERLSTVPEFPTLFELSRNQVRNHIVGYYKVKYPYCVFDIVKGLKIPQDIKDVVLFKSAIH